MAFGWAGAAAGANDKLQQLLARRMEEQLAQARLAAQQQAEANQTALQQEQMGLQRRTFEANDADRTAQRERQGRMDERLAVQDAQTVEDRDIAAADRRQGQNQRGVRSMILEGMRAKTTDPRTAQLMAAGEGVDIGMDVLDPEKGQRDRLEQIRVTAEEARRTAGARSTGGNGGAPRPDAPKPNRALAELAARSGKLPGGTPTLQGETLKELANDPALLKQYEAKRLEPIRAQAQTVLTAVNDLITPEGTLTEGAKGLFGEYTPVWSRSMGVKPTTVGANASLRQVVGQQVVDLIREMKGQSQTGATGFGQLNQAELDIILSAATRLTQRLPEDQAANELKTLREKFSKIMQDDADPDDALLDELLKGRQ